MKEETKKSWRWHLKFSLPILLAVTTLSGYLGYHFGYKGEAKGDAANQVEAVQDEAAHEQPKCMLNGLEIKAISASGKVGLAVYGGIDLKGTVCCLDVDDEGNGINFECDNNIIMRSNKGKIEYIVGNKEE